MILLVVMLASSAFTADEELDVELETGTVENDEADDDTFVELDAFDDDDDDTNFEASEKKRAARKRLFHREITVKSSVILKHPLVVDPSTRLHARTWRPESRVEILPGAFEYNLRTLLSLFHPLHVPRALTIARADGTEAEKIEIGPSWSACPVLKFDVYGNGELETFARIAASYTPCLGVIETSDAARIAPLLASDQFVLRMPDVEDYPASSLESVDWSRQREPPGPILDAFLAAGAATGVIHEWAGSTGRLAALTTLARRLRRVLPVHLYLWDHYRAPIGFNVSHASELAQIVASIDPTALEVRGFMAYSDFRGYEERFLAIVCPVAERLGASSAHPLYMHWLSSADILDGLRNHTRKYAGPRSIPDACRRAHDRIVFLARVGSMLFDQNPTHRPDWLKLRPVLSWSARVGTAIDAGNFSPNSSNVNASLVIPCPDRSQMPIIISGANFKVKLLGNQYLFRN